MGMAAPQGQGQNGYMVMMVPMMLGQQQAMPYQQMGDGCNGSAPQMMWAPQMGGMVAQAPSGMQGPVAMVQSAPGMWGQNGAPEQTPSNGSGFGRQSPKMMDSRKGGKGAAAQRQNPQWFGPSTELSANATEFTPTGSTELS